MVTLKLRCSAYRSLYDVAETPWTVADIQWMIYGIFSMGSAPKIRRGWEHISFHAIPFLPKIPESYTQTTFRFFVDYQGARARCDTNPVAP